MRLSVVIPTHNPQAGRLRRTLAGLGQQTLDHSVWEIVVVDNASSPALITGDWADRSLPNLRLVAEPALGLSHARRCGFLEAKGDLVVLVDDDNVLGPDYLARVIHHFDAEPALGAAGGAVQPEFETPPPGWAREFYGLLALRTCGDAALRADWRGGTARSYPPFAPIGAGLAIRRSLALDYAAALVADPRRQKLDRTGDQLVSGGDNDLVMHVMEAGFSVGYEPDLSLTHLIPARRLEAAYLGALNRAIARSWVRVLALHGIHPWRPIPPRTVPLRRVRAWWRTRAWRGEAAWVKWQGQCGTFEGQADLTAMSEPAMPARRPVSSPP